MGARGPKPKGEYEKQTAVFSSRLTPELRAWVSEAASISGRSLSQEIEHRLRFSFAMDPVAERQYVERALAACLEVVKGWR
jgi:hypothetical protein